MDVEFESKCSMFAAFVEQNATTTGPCNTNWLLQLLDGLYNALISENTREIVRANMPCYVVIWDNKHFHYSNHVRKWFETHQQMMIMFLPPYSPFLIPNEKFFFAWRWKV